jgi:ribosome biogenesis GTPase
MNLEELGWDPFFEKHFDPYRKKGFIPARIALEERNLYTAYSELGELTGKVSGRFRHNTRSRGDFPTVGDWVAVKGNPVTKKMTIHGVLPRKSKFSRKLVTTDGRMTEEQVISANIDTVFLVIALDADFNVRRIERYLTIVQESGANLVVVLNKTDLCTNSEERIKEVKSITRGVPIYALSALKNEGLEQLYTYLSEGQTVTLVGSSGAGKSTLINSILGEERQATGEVREKDGKGRHITVKRELIPFPDGGLFIDNPGMRTISLWGEEEGLETTFEDIVALAQQCRFRDCKHGTEPGCAINQALEDGTLDKKRYENYLKLQQELKVLAMRKDQRARVR